VPDTSPQKRLSLGFFPNAVGWNFPSDSAGKKSQLWQKARLTLGGVPWVWSSQGLNGSQGPSDPPGHPRLGSSVRSLLLPID